jgi:putative FmdB family regulatory protein
MPIYEYACSACEHEFEQIQKFTDPSVCDCPKCHKKNAVHRKLSTSAFHLSGGGWYSDGYGKGGGSKSEGKPESSGGGESKPSEGKPESGGGGESKPSESKTVSAGAHGASGCAA